MVVARKEFADHLLSARFIVLLFVLGLVAAIPLYFAADTIRSRGPGEQRDAGDLHRPVLVRPRRRRPDHAAVGRGVPRHRRAAARARLRVRRRERRAARGTLPRLLSQPIHRDDVINGKFAAGLAVIGLVLVAVVGLIAAFGIIRLGIVPAPSEILRIMLWVAVTFVYVALWLAFGMLLSVVVRQAATSALIGFGVWILRHVLRRADHLARRRLPRPDHRHRRAAAREQPGPGARQPAAARHALPRGVAGAAQSPGESRDVSTPATIGGYQQAQQRIPSLPSLDQSFILVWPQVVALVALTVACFAIAYVRFMRQEVRA